MRDYLGDFEIHVTAEAGDAGRLERFRDWCADRGFKCVHIVLARGEHVSQPMATWRLTNTTLPKVVTEAERAATQLRTQSIPVTRVKVEAAPHNAEIPQQDESAADHPAQNYFEHHLKLLRKAGASFERLSQVCEVHAAHLSRNAFRRPRDGWEERFVTLRCYHVGRMSSEDSLQRLLGALLAVGEQVLEQESEYCVYDSNLALDDSWLTSEV